jgi:phospholipid transport system substrate-binding protein
MKDPYLMMDQVATTTFQNLKEEQNRIQQNPQILRSLVTQDLMPYVNVRYAAYKVLGPYLKKTTRSERDAFVLAFKEYLISSYAQVLTQYTDQSIKIEPQKSIPAGRSIVSVRVTIVDNKRPSIQLDFKLRKNNKTGQWQGFDMVAEGISLISTKTTEWSAVLRQEGIVSLTNKLQLLAKNPIVLERK